MKNITFIIITILASLVIGNTQQTDYVLKEGVLTWKGKAAFSSYYLSGTLNAASSSLIIQNEKIIDGKIILDMLSLDAENDQLQSHLRSKDFFEVDKYQKAIFLLNKEALIVDGKTVLSGDLTIKEKTLPVDIVTTVTLCSGNPKVSGKLIVDRTKFGIYYNSPNFFENLKEHAIDDEFELVFELTYVKK